MARARVYHGASSTEHHFAGAQPLRRRSASIAQSLRELVAARPPGTAEGGEETARRTVPLNLRAAENTRGGDADREGGEAEGEEERVGEAVLEGEPKKRADRDELDQREATPCKSAS